MTGPEAFAYIGEQLHVHPNTARKYARDDDTGGLIHVPLPGGGRRYKPSDVRAFVAHILATSKATG